MTPNRVTFVGSEAHIYIKDDCVCIIDAEDYHKVKNIRWYIRIHRGNKYAISPIIDSNGINHTTFIHQIIMPRISGKMCDHISGITLDNRKSNLRMVTAAENAKNHKTRKDSKTGASGVCWSAKRNMWRAYIYKDKKCINLPFTICFKKAIESRKEAEKKYFGEYCRASI